MLADDIAMIGDDFPFARWQQLDIGDERAAVDFRAELARARSHRIGNVGGCHMAIGDRVECGLHAIGIQKRMNLLDLFGADNVGFIACKLRHAVDLF